MKSGSRPSGAASSPSHFNNPLPTFLMLLAALITGVIGFTIFGILIHDLLKASSK